jgi:hypothetical protein
MLCRRTCPDNARVPRASDRHPERSRGMPVALPLVSSRDSSTPRRYAQNDKSVLPFPRTIWPMRFAFNVSIARSASRAEITAAIPIPILKT